MKITHTSIEQNWLDNKEITLLSKNAKTLVIGSFNPHNPSGNNTDFYYGRCSNYFWKIIAEIKGENEQFYCNRLDRKIKTMQEHSFFFSDLIASIEIDSKNESTLEQFIQNKIFTGYSDSILFRTSTTYKAAKISIRRNYNSEISKMLSLGLINNVIHTLGNVSIDKNQVTKPLEKNLKTNGFQGFWKNLIATHPNVNFVTVSFSPSAYAVKKLGNENYNQLKIWIQTNLLCKHEK